MLLKRLTQNAANGIGLFSETRHAGLVPKKRIIFKQLERARRSIGCAARGLFKRLLQAVIPFLNFNLVVKAQPLPRLAVGSDVAKPGELSCEPWHPSIRVRTCCSGNSPTGSRTSLLPRSRWCRLRPKNRGTAM